MAALQFASSIAEVSTCALVRLPRHLDQAASLATAGLPVRIAIAVVLVVTIVATL